MKLFTYIRQNKTIFCRRQEVSTFIFWHQRYNY